MPDKRYKYTVDLEVDAKTLKNAIKNDISDAVKEAGKIGDALSKGLSPDTKNFENKLTALETKMAQLVTETDKVKDIATSMGTAFKDFEQLRANMQVISEQNKQMYETFVQMTPFMHEFANIFTVMKPEQAAKAMATVIKNMSASGQAGTQAFQDMQTAAEQAGQMAKEKTHEVLTESKKSADVVNGASEVAARTAQQVSESAKKASEELKRLKKIKDEYESDISYDKEPGQLELSKKIRSKIDEYENLKDKLDSSNSSDDDYYDTLVKTIEKGQQLLALKGKINKNTTNGASILDNFEIDLEEISMDIESLFNKLQEKANTTLGKVGKVELKPLKLKVTVEDEAVINSINKSLARITKDIEPLKIPLAFYSADKEEAKIDKQIQKLLKAENVDQEALAKLRKEKAVYEEMQDEKALTSLEKRIKRITDVFDKASEPLSTKIKNFKDDIADALTLQFKWDKTDDNGELNGLFNFIQDTAYENPIALIPDETETINNIQELLNQHKFNITLEGQATVNGIVSNAGGSTSTVNGAPIYVNRSPIYIESGNMIPYGESRPETPMVQIPVGSTYIPPSAKVATPPPHPSSSSRQLDDKTVQHNNNAVDENTEVIRSVVDMFQTWLSRTRSDSKKDALASIGMDFRGLKGDDLFNFFKNLLYNVPNLGDRLSGAKNGTGPTATRLFDNEFVEAIVTAQKQLGVKTTTTQAIDNSLINQQYLKHYELLVRIGQSLNSARTDIERKIIPYQAPLQKLINLLDNNDVLRDWKKKVLDDAKLEVEQTKADAKNAPQKVQEAKAKKEEAGTYVLKREKAVTEAKTAYESAERAYNEARQALEGAEKTGDQKKIDSAKVQVKDAEEKKTSAYSVFKDAERSAQIAQDRARSADAAFKDATTKADMAKTAASVAEARLKKVEAISNNNTAFENTLVAAKDLMSKMKELITKYADGVNGGITKYLSNLDSDIVSYKDRVNNKTLSDADRAIAQQKLDELTSLRDSIFNELKPFVENFDNAKKEIIGDIANLAGNYKFEVVLKDKNGKEQTYSFNNAVEGADKESGPGWYKIVQMLNELPSMDQILSIRTVKNPNMGDMRLLYGDTITQAEAVNNVIEAYQKLDDVTKEFLNKIMMYTSGDKDIVSKFLGNEMPVKDKFDLIRRSFLGDDGKISNSLLLDPLKATTNAQERNAKYIGSTGYAILKAFGFTPDDLDSISSIKDVDVQDFGNVVADAIEKATSERRTRKGRQVQMARNTEKPSGTSLKEQKISPSLRDYSYTAQDREYRTEKAYTLPAVENVQKQLNKNVEELAQANATLTNYNTSLEQAKQSHEQEKTKLDTTSQRKELQKQYSDIKDAQSFQVQYNMAEQETKIRQDMVSENEKKVQDATKNISELNAELTKTETSISSIQSRMDDVDNAGGVQKYLEQLNRGIQDSETLVTRLRDANENFDMRLRDLDFDYKRGKVPKEEYESRKQEIEEIIAENNAEIKSEQEKYIKLKEIRKSFLQEIAAVDRETGATYQLSDQEYKNKKTAELQQKQVEASEIRAEITQSESVLADINSKLQTDKAQLDAEQKNLEQMRIAFAEYYYEYVNKLLSETNAEISKIQNAQKIGKLKDLGLDNDSAAQRLNELGNQKRNYSSESKRISQILNPNIGDESYIALLEKNVEEANARVTKLETEKQTLEQRIAALQSDSLPTKAPAPVESMSDEQKKLSVTREVEAINEDIKLADAKIAEAKRASKIIRGKIKTLTGKNANKSRLVNNAKGAKTRNAMRFLEKNDTEYQALKTHEEKVEYARKFKERDTSGEYQVDAQKLLTIERAKLQTQEEAISAADQKKRELIAEKQIALDILGIAEDQLFAEEKLTQKKQEEAETERQRMQTTTEQPTPPSVLESKPEQPTTPQLAEQTTAQSNNINQGFLDEIQARLDENDAELAELRAQINSNSSSTTSSNTAKNDFTKYTLKLNAEHFNSKASERNKAFYSTLKQGDNNRVDFSDKGNIDVIIKKARELREELNKLGEKGKQGSSEYLTLQRQLSTLLDTTRKWVSSTSLADGYDKNKANKKGHANMSKKGWKKFLSDNGASDLADFVGSRLNIDTNEKFDTALLTDRVKQKIDGFSEQFQQATIKAYTDAFNSTKESLSGKGKKYGEIYKKAQAAGLRAFDEFLKNTEDGFVAGAQESETSPKIDNAKAKLIEDISDLEKENQELKNLRERYIKGMLSEEDNDTLASFIGDPEALLGMAMQAERDAATQVDKTGKTEDQIEQETRALYRKILFNMLTATVIGAEEGIDDVEESFNDKVPSSTGGPSQLSASSNPVSGSYTVGGHMPINSLAIQANNVIINGNSINSPNGENGTGPWALETTLQRTNEILNGINGKIDSVKGGSGSDNDSPTSGSRKKKKKEEEIDVNAIRQRLESEAADNRKRFSIDGLEDSIKSVQKFDEKTLKLYETFTLANGEAVKFTYSLNTMDGTIKSSYTTIANFEGVAKKAYTELGKSQIATKQLFEGFNFPQDKITAYNNAIVALNNKLKGLGENGITDPKDANEVEVLTGNVKKLRTEIENMVKASEKITSSGTLIRKFDVGEVDNVKASMKALAEEIPNASLAASSFNDKTNELTFTVKTGKNELTTLTYKFDELTQSVYETGRASKTTTGFFKTFFSDVGSKISELARYYTGMSLLTEGLQQVKRGVQYVREIDLALTELKKVTDETDASYTKFLQNMSNVAGVVGSTTSELTNSAAD